MSVVRRYEHFHELRKIMEAAAMAWWLFVVASIASIPLSGAMARERNRSSKTWLGIAVAVGPFAPLALLVLGHRRPPSAR